MSADTKVSAKEILESLTGFDEIAIEKHMGVDPYADGETKPIKVMRAMVFVLQTREGLNPAQAKAHAMGMPLRDVEATFADEDEVDEENPITPSGEGFAPSE